jgi:hypothetical protein
LSTIQSRSPRSRAVSARGVVARAAARVLASGDSTTVRALGGAIRASTISRAMTPGSKPSRVTA